MFSIKGIKIVIDYFVNRGHTQIKAMLPRFRRGNSDVECPTFMPELLDDLEQKGYITYTPSRFVKGRLIIPYDDRFILTAAHFHNAIIVSNDNYRDLLDEKPEWRRLVETRLDVFFNVFLLFYSNSFIITLYTKFVTILIYRRFIYGCR